MAYFVRINDTQDVRRRTLESSKDLLQILRGYHQLLEIRARKKEVTEELRHLMGELSLLGAKLDKLLPLQPLKDIQDLLPKHEAPKKKAAKEKPAAPEAKEEPKLAALPKPEPQPKKLTELEKLEQALAGIEQRLGNL